MANVVNSSTVPQLNRPILSGAAPPTGRSADAQSSTVTASAATCGYDIFQPPPTTDGSREFMDIGLLDDSPPEGENQELATQMAEQCRINQEAPGSAAMPGASRGAADERTSAKVPAASFHYVCDAVDHKKRTDKHARSLMWACIFKIRCRNRSPRFHIRHDRDRGLCRRPTWHRSWEGVRGRSPVDVVF